MSKFGGRGPCTCRRCVEENINDIHMFSTCPGLEEIWRDVSEILTGINGCNIKVNSLLILFGTENSANQQITPSLKRLIFYLILLARREICIINWTLPSPPTCQKWLYSVDRVANMDQKVCPRKRTVEMWSNYIGWRQSTN